MDIEFAEQVLRQSARDAWKKACEYQGVDPNSTFVAFTDDNPFGNVYNNMLGLYFEKLKERRNRKC